MRRGRHPLGILEIWNLEFGIFWVVPDPLPADRLISDHASQVHIKCCVKKLRALIRECPGLRSSPGRLRHKHKQRPVYCHSRPCSYGQSVTVLGFYPSHCAHRAVTGHAQVAQVEV